MSFAFFFSSPESIVQKAPFPFDSSVLTGEVLEGYSHFKKTKWSHITNKQGRTIVEFIGEYNPPSKNIEEVERGVKSNSARGMHYFPPRSLEGWVLGFKDDLHRPIDIIFQFTLNKDNTFTTAVGAMRNEVLIEIKNEIIIKNILSDEPIEDILYRVLASDQELQKMSIEKYREILRANNDHIFEDLYEQLKNKVGMQFLKKFNNLDYDVCFTTLTIVNVDKTDIEFKSNSFCVKYNTSPSCYKIKTDSFVVSGKDSMEDENDLGVMFELKDMGLLLQWRYDRLNKGKAKFSSLGTIDIAVLDSMYNYVIRIGDLLTDEPCEVLPQFIKR